MVSGLEIKYFWKVKTICLLYGGNMGETLAVFEKATAMLVKKIGPVYRQSSVYRSQAWGYESKNDFINQLVLFKTEFKAQQVLHYCLETESLLGRKRNNSPGYSDRTIDIDILYMDDLILSTDQLTIPHPRLHERLFALLPLCDVIPEFIHPVLQKSNKSLLDLCPDKSTIEKLD